jgi:hypothetical protein
MNKREKNRFFKNIRKKDMVWYGMYTYKFTINLFIDIVPLGNLFGIISIPKSSYTADPFKHESTAKFKTQIRISLAPSRDNIFRVIVLSYFSFGPQKILSGKNLRQVQQETVSQNFDVSSFLTCF